METTLPARQERQERQLSVIEDTFEQEDIQQQKSSRKSKLNRFRENAGALTKSKQVLLLVVLLNCLDCILVLTELLLDVHFIGGMIVTAENTMERFNRLLQERYPAQFAGADFSDTHFFYNKILHSTLVFQTNETVNYAPMIQNITKRSIIESGSTENDSAVGVLYMDVMATNKSFADHDDPDFLDEISDSWEEYVSHVFHKTSIAILGILVAFTVFKVFCEGSTFLKHKLEVFDAIVVVASFTLDLCYIRGLTNYRAESFVLILVIMIPWRIIRVLNSLVIAVKDNFHFMLKIMYKKNKVNAARIDLLEKHTLVTESCISSLAQLCTARGVSITEINAILDRDGYETTSIAAMPRMLGACFGLNRQDSCNGNHPPQNMEMTPLTDAHQP